MRSRDSGLNGNQHLVEAEHGECTFQPGDQDSVENADARTRDIYIPELDEIKSELWRIATSECSESARVSAIRVLVDVMGFSKPEPAEFPEGMNALLDALAEGLVPDSASKTASAGERSNNQVSPEP